MRFIPFNRLMFQIRCNTNVVGQEAVFNFHRPPEVRRKPQRSRYGPGPHISLLLWHAL
ncbi:hypothetical protein M378DRAFT_167008 [Amanita muscaria Koide BX008]|uniref:Uncharacterized protein n=1 Tax=Amanita muscaria (strain Koide BX008) TaxID=946122 RepID=A0A0C2WIK9_AMAMK|nr:hypothetical protein M378DRAFT_167008 [Amanita muscaria Koide BX008]